MIPIFMDVTVFPLFWFSRLPDLMKLSCTSTKWMETVVWGMITLISQFKICPLCTRMAAHGMLHCATCTTALHGWDLSTGWMNPVPHAIFENAFKRDVMRCCLLFIDYTTARPWRIHRLTLTSRFWNKVEKTTNRRWVPREMLHMKHFIHQAKDWIMEDEWFSNYYE